MVWQPAACEEYQSTLSAIASYPVAKSRLCARCSCSGSVPTSTPSKTQISLMRRFTNSCGRGGNRKRVQRDWSAGMILFT